MHTRLNRTTPKRTLLANALALALIAALSGCSSKNGSPQPQDAAGRRDARSVAPAIVEPKEEQDTLDEVGATGSRISQRAQPEQSAPALGGTMADKSLAEPAYALNVNAPKPASASLPIADLPAPPPAEAVAVSAAVAPSAEMVVNTENYAESEINPIKKTALEPVSTFSVDVDTGSYTNVRRMLTQENRLPPNDAVRAEEFINYFDYQYPQPANRSQPFSVTMELGAAPWNAERELLLVGLKGFEMQKSEIPPANLVFLIDVSGSMNEPNKLPLVKQSLTQMIERLGARDRVSIVVYAGAAGVVLESTPGSDKASILQALDRLAAGGSTNGGEGIALAYKIAKDNLIKGGVNRIILASDGDFNVGQFSPDALKEYISKQRDSGVSFSTLGFGSYNYNDAMAEQLADVGNGKYAYIDSLKEGERVLGREIAGSLFTIASDVKIQMEFNPAVVSEYRLIGYSNRVLAAEDFNNDKVDAGDIGVGHSVTALYEITRVGNAASVDALRYAPAAKPALAVSKELGFLKLRYKLPNQSISTLISKAIPNVENAGPRLLAAASVAAFAEHLQGGKYLGQFDLTAIGALAQKSLLSAEAISELAGLIEQAKVLRSGQPPMEISATQ